MEKEEKNTIQKSELAQKEEGILSYWKERDIFEKTLKKDSPRGDFVFYEGPPTANGRPGIHHLESRAFKDLFPRYKTMQGYRVLRKAGWDTHGLPVELEVEKQIGVTSKKEIEAYGIARFNDECKKSVWKYVDEWEKFTERIGYWVDLRHPYITYVPEYIESIWNIFSEIENKKLLYKDYKVVPWCPRCGTALSSHELAQGYADVKDLSVYVKFKVVGEDNTYVLAWTTTPWTLPGNVALAVNKDISYAKFTVAEINDDSEHKANIKIGETYIYAKERERDLFGGAVGIDQNGKWVLNANGYNAILNDYVAVLPESYLLNISYEPLYPFLKQLVPTEQAEQIKKAWKIYPASFVSTEDGTGIVHTAVMYGQDDFELGTQIGLPKFHLVDEAGHFIENTGVFSKRFVKDEEVAVDVIKDLAHRGLLLKKEKYEHSYPFCWRCKTPLIYYARDSWYIRMSSLRDDLMKENQTIHWEPEHTRDGRFGEWLKEVKDWAISRERYWGTPLPIWESLDKKERMVIGSIEELKQKIKRRNNHFIFIRHGESEHNVLNVISADEKDEFHLTNKGKEESKRIAENLSGKKITAVYASPFLRTKETAEIIADALSIGSERIVFDRRLREYNFGEYHRMPFSSFLSYEEEHMRQYNTPIPGGESYLDAKKRFGDFVYEVDAQHENSTIVVVTHGIGLEVMEAIIEGADMNRSKQLIEESNFSPGSMLEFDFTPLPCNGFYEIDLHKPFIDDVVLVNKEGQEFKRVREVMDVWFDSGAMPYAQHHYPFENKDWFDQSGYPADFICEAIDQTRGWFYTLHAIGTLLGKGKAFKNVICLGHILDKDGQKMSKSRGNTLNPWQKIDQYGADVLRFWMYSVNQPGESKNFDERTVDDVVKKVFNLLLNVVSFYEMYKVNPPLKEVPKSSHPLDRWITLSLEKVESEVTNALNAYRPLEAARVVRDFTAELSQWYVRRSRDRFKGDDEGDKEKATETLGFVLYRVAKILAPFTPFFAEYIYQKIGGDFHTESVHLESWSQGRSLSEEENRELARMQTVRDLVSMVLETRARFGIKIRQPMRSVTFQDEELKNYPELVQVLLDEVNVKEVFFDKTIQNPIILDEKIDENLRREGDSRELIRAIQESRKNQSLVPGDMIDVVVDTTQDGKETVLIFNEYIKKVCNIRNIEITTNSHGEGSLFKVSISRI